MKTCGTGKTSSHCLLICLIIAAISIAWLISVNGVSAELASGGKFVGNITQSGIVPNGFEKYWNQITCENEGKWESVERTRDTMDWSGIDHAYNFARQKGMPFKHHTFVWGQQYPSWMKNLSQTEQREEVEEWIRLYCERYPDPDMIDVVNEPDHEASPSPDWFNAIDGTGQSGYDWVIWSFEKAREYCPDATLILNDYNVLIWNTSNFVSIARKLKDRGLIDAVGAQAHGLENLSFAELKANFNQVAALGLPIYISEYDINIADDNRQMQVMQQQFTFFYENPQVAGITFWGYIYGQTWNQKPYAGLIRYGEPRPAMDWLCTYFTGKDCDGTAGTDPTPEPSPEGDHTIVVSAYGTTGQEIIKLNIAGSTIATWQLTTGQKSYTAGTNATGEITVEFINDTGDPDVFVDYIVVDGEIRQAEDQAYNTGAWADGQCGGGSYTEWLHCNGAISFGDLTGITEEPEPDPEPDNDETGGCGGGGWTGGCGN